MHLLYLDESGHAADPSSDYFVLAGFSIFERQTHWLESQLDPIAARFNAANPREIEFHGSVMRAGRDEWKGIEPGQRAQAVVDILSLLSDKQLKLRVYACVVEKSQLPTKEILSYSFEKIAACFDGYLKSLYLKNDPQRGLIILDKSNYEEKIQTLTHVFKHIGHANGVLRNFAEVPLFLDSKASRLIQMADLVAYWIYRRYQSGDARGYALIEPFIAKYGPATDAHIGLHEIICEPTRLLLENLPQHSHPFPKKSVASQVAVSGLNSAADD